MIDIACGCDIDIKGFALTRGNLQNSGIDTDGSHPSLWDDHGAGTAGTEAKQQQGGKGWQVFGVEDISSHG
ncbi:hypothetical protein GCM10008938_09550 [Deinococcus roseus]|uniref:Uncharacterized protein n=1 Tax=Deinococcus roseus TaxID=392414 RepID=A0ABQ2CY77_9DEIO|nr:hypothetical protein GCM10008938_09550 [Deinococcus roseus]